MLNNLDDLVQQGKSHQIQASTLDDQGDPAVLLAETGQQKFVHGSYQVNPLTGIVTLEVTELKMGQDAVVQLVVPFIAEMDIIAHLQMGCTFNQDGNVFFLDTNSIVIGNFVYRDVPKPQDRRYREIFFIVRHDQNNVRFPSNLLQSYPELPIVTCSLETANGEVYIAFSDDISSHDSMIVRLPFRIQNYEEVEQLIHEIDGGLFTVGTTNGVYHPDVASFELNMWDEIGIGVLDFVLFRESNPAMRFHGFSGPAIHES